MSDPHTYTKRLQELKQARAEEKTQTLRNLYDEAITLTENALRLAADLQDVASEYFETASANTRQRLDLQERRLERYSASLRAAVKAMTSPNTAWAAKAAQLTAQSIRTVLQTDVANVNTEIAHIGATLKVQVALKIIDRLFTEVYGQKLNSFDLDAAIDGFNTGFGMIPIVGNIYSGLVAIANIARRKQRRRAQASQHVSALEDYCEALRSWMAVTYSSIRVMQP